MTGFGQSGRIANGYRIQVDMKSVNHRYCEIVPRLPREWTALEDSLKKAVQRQIKRGRVDIFVLIEPDQALDKLVEIDWSLAFGYRQAADQLRERLGLNEQLSLQQLLSLPDVIRFREDSPATLEMMENDLLICAEEALDQLIRMRIKEGSHLQNDLADRLDALRVIQQSLASWSPQAVEEYRVRLRQRMAELLPEASGISEDRLAIEVALLAERSSIDEELTRLESHIAQLDDTLRSTEPVGRKLDFLLQEMNREANTIGSKANHTAMAGLVVELKAELEKIREQVQNIE
jgi:uncharacterized protein (TIGR00255 family)